MRELKPVRPHRRRWRRSLLVVAVAVLGLGIAVVSCAPVGYYAQSVAGGTKVLLKRKPIDRLLAGDRLTEDERQMLERVQALRRYAVEQLGLPDNGSYQTYADLGRPYATWNVVAAPRYSVEPKIWCFAVAGCVSYRGYFSKRRAERYAEKLVAQGYDVSLGGSPAYSTLGWFKDPVLNTFLTRSEHDLAGLIFHELAHQRLYVKDDTAFNESFATAVEIEGVRRWLTDSGRANEIGRYELGLERQRQVNQLLLETRAQLAEGYAQADNDDERARVKEEGFRALRGSYERLKQEWDADPYGDYFARELNNADLVSSSDYSRWVAAFTALLVELEDLAAFYDRVERLSALSPSQRSDFLETKAGS